MSEKESLFFKLAKLFPFEKNKWRNEPIPYNIEEYESAQKRFVEVFASNTNVRSIYQFGFVKHPGISDLDFLLILRDKPGKYAIKKDIYSTFSLKDRYLFNNTPPFIVNKEIFHNFYKILPLSNLIWLSGEKVELQEKKDDEIFNLLILIEICSHFYPKIFLELFKKRTFNIRRGLLLLNSLQYPLSIASRVLGKSDEWNHFNSKVNKLREVWFITTEDKYKILYDLLLKAIWVSTCMIEKVGDYLQKGKSISSAEGLYIGSFLNGRMLFLKEFRKELALKIILETYERSGKFISILPSSFLSSLMIYKQENGQISRHIKNNLSVYGEIPPYNNPKTAVERIRLMNFWIDFIEKNRITVDMVHIYYGYRPSVCLKNRLINLIVKYYKM